MSAIRKCRECGGNIVEPAYPGDGAYLAARDAENYDKDGYLPNPLAQCKHGYVGACGICEAEKNPNSASAVVVGDALTGTATVSSQPDPPHSL